MNPKDDKPSISSMIRWAYWPATPNERGPLYATAIVLLAAALVDRFSRLSTGAAAFFVFWPLSYLLVAPLVRTALHAATKNDAIFHKGPLRRTVFIVVGLLWAFTALGFVLTPAISTLDDVLFFVTPLSLALLAGVPIAAAMLTGAQPGTPNYINAAHGWIGEVERWLRTFPLSVKDKPEEPEKLKDEWYDPHAKPPLSEDPEDQNIPWDEQEEPFSPPEIHTYPWACQVLNVSETTTYDQIQAAYRLLAQQHHPDLATSPRDAAERADTMTRINVAWGIIKSHHQNRA